MQKLYHYSSSTRARLQSHFRISISNTEPRVKNRDLDYIIYTLADHFSNKVNPIQYQNCLIPIPYPKLNCL